MNYLRGAFADAKLRYRVNKTVGDATTAPSPASYTPCVALADEHPNLVLVAIKDRATYSHTDTTYKALTLLEHLVGACNYAFHEALAQHTSLQDKIVQLAIRRAEDDPHRRVQRLCRLTLLEYSRMFADDPALRRLSTLAKQFEQRTHKNLLRCLNIQNKHVSFRAVSAQDIVMLGPLDGPRTSVGVGVKDLAPLKFSKAEVWLCHVCNYMNAPAAHRCAACETARTVGDGVPAAPERAAAAGSSAANRGEAVATLTGVPVSPHAKGARAGSHTLSESVLVSRPLQNHEDTARNPAEEDEELTGEGTPLPAPPPGSADWATPPSAHLANGAHVGMTETHSVEDGHGLPASTSPLFVDSTAGKDEAPAQAVVTSVSTPHPTDATLTPAAAVHEAQEEGATVDASVDLR